MKGSAVLKRMKCFSVIMAAMLLVTFTLNAVASANSSVKMSREEARAAIEAMRAKLPVTQAQQPEKPVKAEETVVPAAKKHVVAEKQAAPVISMSEVVAPPAAPSATPAAAPAEKAKEEKKEEKKAPVVYPFDLSGYAQFLYSDNTAAANGSTVNLSRMRFIGKKKIDEKLMLFVQSNFTGNSDTASKLTVLDVNAQYDLGGGRSVWLGQFVMPFGFESPISPKNLHMINYSQESVNTEHEMAGDDLRDVGVRYNYAPKDCHFNLSVAAVNGEGINRRADTNDNKAIVGRLGYVFNKFFNIGLSGYEGKRYKAASAAVASYGTMAAATTAGDFLKRRAAFDFTYKKDRLMLQGEYHLFRTGVQGRLSDLIGQGYFVQGGLMLSKTFEFTLKHDAFTPNKNNTTTKKTINAAGFNWYFHKAAKMQFVYQKHGETPEVDNNRVDSLLCFDF